MSDAWLFEVLVDLDEYAIANELDWLVPVINKANIAARWELRKCGSAKSGMAKRTPTAKAIAGESQADSILSRQLH